MHVSFNLALKFSIAHFIAHSERFLKQHALVHLSDRKSWQASWSCKLLWSWYRNGLPEEMIVCTHTSWKIWYLGIIRSLEKLFWHGRQSRDHCLSSAAIYAVCKIKKSSPIYTTSFHIELMIIVFATGYWWFEICYWYPNRCDDLVDDALGAFITWLRSQEDRCDGSIAGIDLNVLPIRVTF